MNKVALVTGAASNIGKGIARSLLSSGFNCVLLDKDAALLHQTYGELGKLGSCYEYEADVSDITALKQLVDWLKEQKLDVDTLINNVGYNSRESFLELSPEAMRQSNQVNLEGPFYLTNLLAKNMISSSIKGNIVFISSIHSKVIRTHPMYSVAKAGIEMFVKEAALELAPHGIRINAIAPGPVKDTTSLEPNKYVPLGYILQPKDIADSLVFMVSDNARFITGQSLVVDGGFSLNHTHQWIKENKL